MNEAPCAPCRPPGEPPIWIPIATLGLKISKLLSSGHQAGLGPWWLRGESKWQASSLELNLPLEQNTCNGLKEGPSKRPGVHIHALIWSEAAPRNAPRELLLWSPTSWVDVWTVTFLYINHTDFLRGSLQLLYCPLPSHFSVSKLHLESFITFLLWVWQPLACLPAWGLCIGGSPILSPLPLWNVNPTLFTSPTQR